MKILTTYWAAGTGREWKIGFATAKNEVIQVYGSSGILPEIYESREAAEAAEAAIMKLVPNHVKSGSGRFYPDEQPACPCCARAWRKRRGLPPDPELDVAAKNFKGSYVIVRADGTVEKRV